MQVSDDWGKVVNPSKVSGPVVYQFQPTKYLKVHEDRLREWEEFFRENVGLVPDPKAVAQLRPDWNSATLSACGGDWCDCDYV